MTNAQTPEAVRSNAGKKAAATRAAKAAAAKGVVEGPKGKPMPAANALPEVTDEQRKGERRQQQADLAAQFAPTEQTVPAVHDTPIDEEAMKLKAFQEAVQAMAASMGVPVPALDVAPAKQAKAPRPDKQVQNNITRPATGTTTGAIWDHADKISATKNGNGFASIAELRAVTELRQTNEHTLKTQYARWRTYHGLKGRAPAPAQAARTTPEGNDDGIAAAFNRRANDPKPA